MTLKMMNSMEGIDDDDNGSDEAINSTKTI